MAAFSLWVFVFDQVHGLLVQVRRAAELPMCEEAVHRKHARARHERREGSEEEDALVEDPRQALGDALLARDAAAMPVGVENVSQCVEPERVRLHEGHLVAEIRVMAHVAVNLGRLALLGKPIIVLLGLVPRSEHHVKFVQIRHK